MKNTYAHTIKLLFWFVLHRPRDWEQHHLHFHVYSITSCKEHAESELLHHKLYTPAIFVLFGNFEPRGAIFSAANKQIFRRMLQHETACYRVCELPAKALSTLALAGGLCCAEYNCAEYNCARYNHHEQSWLSKQWSSLNRGRTWSQLPCPAHSTKQRLPAEPPLTPLQFASLITV